MSPSPMDAVEIIYRLRRLGKSQAQIARELGVAGGVVSNVIHSRITAYAVASHIAGLLECRVEDLWPSRYVFKPRKSAVNRRGARKETKPEGETACPD